MRMNLRMVVAVAAISLAATRAIAADEICGAARQAECDPKLAECLRDHAEEAKIAACMAKFRECGDRLRMSAAACERVSGQIQIAPGLGVAPEGAPVR